MTLTWTEFKHLVDKSLPPGEWLVKSIDINNHAPGVKLVLDEQNRTVAIYNDYYITGGPTGGQNGKKTL